jgi:hypothetical protein
MSYAQITIAAALAATLSCAAWGQGVSQDDLMAPKQQDAPSPIELACPTYTVCSHPPWWPPVALRCYTPGEIDLMRAVVRKQIEHEYCIKGSDGVLLCPFPPSMAGMVEDRLRTYIAAGVAPEELEAMSRKEAAGK